MASNKIAIARVLNRRSTRVVTFILLLCVVFQILYSGFGPLDMDSVFLLAIGIFAFGVLLKWHYCYWLLVGAFGAFSIRGCHSSYSLWNFYLTKEPPKFSERIFHILPFFGLVVIVPILLLFYYVFSYLREAQRQS